MSIIDPADGPSPPHNGKQAALQAGALDPAAAGLRTDDKAVRAGVPAASNANADRGLDDGRQGVIGIVAGDRPAGPAEPDKAEPGRARTVADIMVGRKDGRGALITFVYFKRDDYAIYATGWQRGAKHETGGTDEIVIAYSDAREVADRQIAAVGPLLPLRDHLIHLTSDMPLENARRNYRAQIADALRLGLEGQPPVAQAILGEAVQDALAVQARTGRIAYLKWAVAMALIVAIVLIPLGGWFVQDRSGVHLLLMATGAGALGALLSIAIGLRNRTVAIDGNVDANAMDAPVRILIGIISAAVLFLVVNSGFLTDLQAGSVKLSGAQMQWQVALIVGFAAGFLERLVPDLLEKKVEPARPATAVAPVASRGGISPGAAAG
jgi:hypothetical protein